MIETNLIGGMTNQIFQYCAGRALAHRLNTDLIINISAFTMKGYPNHKCQIDKFKIKGTINPNNSSLINNYREKHFHYDPDFLNITDGTYIHGYWQSFKYLEPIRNIILKEIVPVIPTTVKLTDHIPNKSVAVHFRRTDYLQYTNLGCLSLDYYYAAVSYIAKQLGEDIRLYIFSDDIEWVKQNFKPNYNHSYINVSGIDDFVLQSKCDHNIIANSSYSLFAAWMNENPNKIVIHPNIWFHDKSHQTIDLFPKNWIGF
jgi:hypothetical protein